jgi:hypothetical protein
VTAMSRWSAVVRSQQRCSSLSGIVVSVHVRANTRTRCPMQPLINMRWL